MNGKTLRIVMVSHTSEFSGGAERSMLDVCTQWQREYDVDIHFIVRKPTKELANTLREKGFSCHPVYFTHWLQPKNELNQAQQKWYAQQNSKAIDHIQGILQRVRPDVVMTNSSVVPWGAIAAKRASVPHIWFIREQGFDELRGVIPEKDLYEDIDCLSAGVVANSVFMKNQLQDHIVHSPIKVLYPSFETSSLAANVPEVFNNPSSIKLILVGRIKRSKGQLDAVQAVGILTEQKQEAELCLIGDVVEEDYMKEITDQIEKDGTADRIHILGAKPNAEALACIAQADIGLMSSSSEAFGRTTIEYMRLSKPVIGSDSGATPELIVDGKAGYLYPPNDSGELVQRLTTYIDSPQLLADHSTAAGKRAAELEAMYDPGRLLEYAEKLSQEKSSLSMDSPTHIEKYIEDTTQLRVRRSARQWLQHKARELYLMLR